jgi:hypothetical protein
MVAVEAMVQAGMAVEAGLAVETPVEAAVVEAADVSTTGMTACGERNRRQAGERDGQNRHYRYRNGCPPS